MIAWGLRRASTTVCIVPTHFPLSMRLDNVISALADIPNSTKHAQLVKRTEGRGFKSHLGELLFFSFEKILFLCAIDLFVFPLPCYLVVVRCIYSVLSWASLVV